MIDCTHVPDPPCARCRVEKFVCEWALFGEPMKEHHAEECESELRNLLVAHAAAAEKRGRREAFEEAARESERLHDARLSAQRALVMDAFSEAYGEGRVGERNLYEAWDHYEAQGTAKDGSAE